MTNDATDRLLVGVELGGTKTIAVVGRGREILDRAVVPTTTPRATLDAVATRLKLWDETFRPQGLGIASFGPVALRAGTPDHGHMLDTPKPGWAGADVLGPLAAVLPGPAAIHTDVTGAALAEGRWGAAAGLSDFVYITVGTGVGMGIVSGGRPVSGRMHPEAGHLRVRRLPGDDFAGVCPFHGDCLEGLASGPAIAARAGKGAEHLAPDDPAWAFVADALAEGIVMLMLTVSAQAIVIGGGVGLGQPQVLAMIRPRIVALLGGYLPGVDAGSIDRIVVPAALGGDAGPLGALLLAEMAVEQSSGVASSKRQ
ncbi:ROK family protein [Sphingomonas nostoxanthinifaciens]|uniref:ROK family protein n=1 Tax=Sphingomonas nostoxanthinifaciens TaxID=2872652 RepID=UPI001CC203FC|nr:ROK family protein [Sphingomonas nostoxanthinifaciens]UAK26079.1 ROK family protein [Sphingomonas nostoxanthinifaciens]